MNRHTPLFLLYLCMHPCFHTLTLCCFCQEISLIRFLGNWFCTAHALISKSLARLSLCKHPKNLCSQDKRWGKNCIMLLFIYLPIFSPKPNKTLIRLRWKRYIYFIGFLQNICLSGPPSYKPLFLFVRPMNI